MKKLWMWNAACAVVGVIALSGILTMTLSAQAPATWDGIYQIDGSNPGAPDKVYQGAAQIAKVGESVYRARTVVNGDVFEFFGFADGNSVLFLTGLQGPMAVRVARDGHVRWAHPGIDAVGVEFWTRTDKKTLQEVLDTLQPRRQVRFGAHEHTHAAR